MLLSGDVRGTLPTVAAFLPVAGRAKSTVAKGVGVDFAIGFWQRSAVAVHDITSRNRLALLGPGLSFSRRELC